MDSAESGKDKWSDYQRALSCEQVDMKYSSTRTVLSAPHEAVPANALVHISLC
jgi:hypothetical protein